MKQQKSWNEYTVIQDVASLRKMHVISPYLILQIVKNVTVQSVHLFEGLKVIWGFYWGSPPGGYLVENKNKSKNLEGCDATMGGKN